MLAISYASTKIGLSRNSELFELFGSPYGRMKAESAVKPPCLAAEEWPSWGHMVTCAHLCTNCSKCSNFGNFAETYREECARPLAEPVPGHAELATGKKRFTV